MPQVPLSPRGDSKNYPHSIHSFVRLIVRILQFILAITVAGLYGVDLQHANEANAYADGRWVYAEVVAGVSAISVFFYLLHWRWLLVWDFLLFVLWTALFGIFGKIYIPAHPTPRQSGQWRMKHAVWVDLVNMLLWFITFLSGLVIWWGGKGKTLHTARAEV